MYNVNEMKPFYPITEYRDAFDVFDRDGNGKVSSDELGPLMRSLGANPKDEHLQDLINEVDYDGVFVYVKNTREAECTTMF